MQAHEFSQKGGSRCRHLCQSDQTRKVFLFHGKTTTTKKKKTRGPSSNDNIGSAANKKDLNFSCDDENCRFFIYFFSVFTIGNNRLRPSLRHLLLIKKEG